MDESSQSMSISDANTVLESWKKFSLDQRKIALDKTCIEMRELKTASINGRKRLNDLTKTFRAKAKEEQTVMITEVLKAYQEEIDQLSRRSKFSETAFFGVFKALFEIPDPCVCIESLLNTVTTGSTHQLEIERLRSELSQYDEEFQQLKNQDITIRRLEDQLQEFKDLNEEKIAEEVEKRVSEIQSQADQRVSEVKEIQRALEKRLAEAQEAVLQAQKSADRAQTELFEISTSNEKRISGLLSENSMLAEGTQRLSLRVVETEAEINSLRQQLNAANNNNALKASDSSNSLSAAEKEKENNNILTLQMVIKELREELHTYEDTARQEKQKHESIQRDLLQQLQKEKELTQRTKQQLDERPTRDEIIALRRQLRSVQRIAFNVHDDDDDGDDTIDTPESTEKGQQQLEFLLANRLKSLETELTETRRDLAESRALEASSKEMIATLNKSLETSTALIARLEADLEHKALSISKNIVPNASNKAILASLHSSNADSSSNNNLIAAGSGTVELAELLGVDENSSSSTTAAVVSFSNNSSHHGGTKKSKQHQQQQQQEDSSNSNQMVLILQGQRDRYKERLTKAESSLLKLQQQIDAAESIKQQLESDNLTLYSKIRYLQSYKPGGNSSTSSGNNSKFMITNVSTSKRNSYAYSEEGRMNDDDTTRDDDDGSGGGSSEIEQRYHALYETRMNPFHEFSQHEKQRKLQELTVADRIVLNTAMAIISNNTGRNFLLIYLVAMHLLVFITIYYSAHRVHYGCDPALDHHNAFAAAAAAHNNMT